MKKDVKIFKLLFEEESSVNTPEKSMTMTSTGVRALKALDSVDDQIDALILKYEASSIREESKKVDGLLESLYDQNLKFLIEQEEGEEAPEAVVPPEDADADAEPPEAPEAEGSEKMSADEPGEELVPDLDIDAFASRTIRLILNHRTLLRMEEAIINRVKNFLDKNYGENFVKSYLDILNNQYGISMEEYADERDIADEKFAVGAFAGGTGGLGGGA